MAIDLTLKSTAITNREANPRVLNTAGAGAAGRVFQVYGYILSVTAALSVTSVIRLVEVPSNAFVTSVKISSGAQAAGKFNIGVYRKPIDGGLIAFTSSDSFFTTDLDCAAAVNETECVQLATTGNTPSSAISRFGRRSAWRQTRSRRSTSRRRFTRPQ
jgi:hypothetical protein